MNTRDLIEGLRGGVPEACDFCRQPRASDELEPEEAGEWVCHECLRRWEEAEALAARMAEAERTAVKPDEVVGASGQVVARWTLIPVVCAMCGRSGRAPGRLDCAECVKRYALDEVIPEG